MPRLSIEQKPGTISFQDEMRDLFDDVSPRRAIHESVAAFKKLPSAFNVLRMEINAAHTEMTNFYKAYERFMAVFGNQLGIGLTAVVTATNGTVVDVDDDSRFVEALARIGEERDVRKKMRSCVALSLAIDTKIKSYNGKITKLVTRRELAGSTESENETAMRLEASLRESVALLRKRGDAVSQIYYAARSALNSFVATCDAAFKPVFDNPKK